MLIKNEFVQKIESGYYRPGDLIPSDNELMRTLNVSKPFYLFMSYGG